jgi:hypothetical protein
MIKPNSKTGIATQSLIQTAFERAITQRCTEIAQQHVRSHAKIAQHLDSLIQRSLAIVIDKMVEKVSHVNLDALGGLVASAFLRHMDDPRLDPAAPAELGGGEDFTTEDADRLIEKHLGGI